VDETSYHFLVLEGFLVDGIKFKACHEVSFIELDMLLKARHHAAGVSPWACRSSILEYASLLRSFRASIVFRLASSCRTFFITSAFNETTLVQALQKISFRVDVVDLVRDSDS
jgi:hypothetical protein